MQYDNHARVVQPPVVAGALWWPAVVQLTVAVILPCGRMAAGARLSATRATTQDLRGAGRWHQYVLPFEVASLLLTGAMIGAIVIARDTED